MVRLGVERSRFDARPAWVLQTRQTAVVVCLGAADALLLPYWGAQGETNQAADFLPHVHRNRSSQREFLDGQPLAYPVYGEASFAEPCLVVSREDGSREVRLTFVEDRVSDVDGQPVLELLFRDDLLGLQLTHRFGVFPDLDLVARSVTVRNTGIETLVLERVLSGSLPLSPGEYDALTLHGQWGREFELHARALLPGKFVTESRRGLSSHEAHPWFGVRPRGERAEHAGSVWFGSLAWSGNWVSVFETHPNDAVSIAMGMQPFDFAWRLAPGEAFSTPELVGGFTELGLSGAARLLHVYEETIVLPANLRDQLRPVLYNSWEPTHFDVRAEQQIDLARRAAEMGVELFVIDDGWFGARDNDRAGLGDWSVNRSKLPDGLRRLVDEVHTLGMQFGIWVEPEMVNPDSDLFRAHPDWAYHAEGRETTLGRNQLVLNFARPDVQSAIHEQLRRLLTDHGRIDFVKWDHNRAWTEVGWPEQPNQQREVWVRHVRGLYDVLARLRAEFPHLSIESCASGGGRADLGMLRFTDQVWTSDNTDAADRLQIQYGYSRAHSPRTMVNWVTDVPNQQTGRLAPLAFRFHVTMQGVLGIGGDIGRWPASDLAAGQAYVEAYKRLRAVVQQGRQYWLVPPTSIGPCAVQYVSAAADVTVVFEYQIRGLQGAGVRRARLHGLLPSRRYRREDDGLESTGAALMGAGLPLEPLSSPATGQPTLDWRSRTEVWRAV